MTDILQSLALFFLAIGLLSTNRAISVNTDAINLIVKALREYKR